jgi:hypothetical protein
VATKEQLAFLELFEALRSPNPPTLLKILEEDELDPAERVQRCQADARQYLE